MNEPFVKRSSPFDEQLKEKKNLIGAEIGVYRGEHALAMLESLDIKKIYLIDPYCRVVNFLKVRVEIPSIQGIPVKETKIFRGEEAWKKLKQLQDFEIYFVGGKVPLREILMAEKQAKELLEKNFKEKIKWIYKRSEEAGGEIEDGSLDFVYIDADHSYGFVKKDIEIWTKKVKSGGLVGGHDYDPGRFDGVVKAVNEYCKKNKIHFETKNVDWFFWKK